MIFWKNEKSFAKTIEKNIELLLIDDGSNDTSEILVDEYSKKYQFIKSFHKSNGGLSDARNAGLKIARGIYICFVDSDDWVHSKYIECLHEACIAYSAGIAACDFRMVYEENIIEEDWMASINNRKYTTEQALTSLIQGKEFRAVAWNKLFQRELLNEEEFPVGRYHEDEFFTYRVIAKANRLAYVDYPLYFYYQRTGSIMNSVSIRHLDALDAIKERMNLLESQYPKLYESDKILYCSMCVNFYCDAKKIEKGKRVEYKERIRQSRKQVSFSFNEILGCSFKEKIYIIGSGLCLNFFCKILNVVRKR